MRSPKDFFAPLAVGAPAPLREVPATPSRVIHFLDPGNEKMTAKVPAMVGTVPHLLRDEHDVALGGIEDRQVADLVVDRPFEDEPELG